MTTGADAVPADLRPPFALRAAWVFPVAGPPIAGGVVEVDGDGRIASLHGGRSDGAIDLGDCAIVPALVNAHVHLEFSDLKTPILPTHPFPRWIGSVVAHRRGRTQPVAEIIRRGMDEVLDTGAVAVGEIATHDDANVYGNSPLDVTAFRELISPRRESWTELLAAAERFLNSVAGLSGVHAGLSPHSPYTVPQELFERSVELARRYDVPVAVHLAETPAERELLAEGRGELVEMLRAMDLWRPELHPPGRRPLDWLRLLAEVPRGLVIHGNDLGDDEIAFLAATELTLVYCPRTHALFGHRPHPFRTMLERGGRLALGTDGRSSNPDLDLWEEAKFLRQRHPDLPSDTMLEFVTRNGAEALGVADRFGVLEVGRRADFLAIRTEATAGGQPPDLFAAGSTIAWRIRAEGGTAAVVRSPVGRRNTDFT